VEDEEMIALVARAMLEELGFEIILATNGREALERYHAKSDIIRIVVTDLGMPVMDGYELIGELKKICPKVPIVITSGFGDMDILSRVDRSEVLGLLSKPYGFDQLCEVMEHAMERT
jgi:CheY-like chemotaxis protein